MNWQKWKVRLKHFVQFLTNPRFLFCFGIAWIITNGWSYLMMGFGTYFEIPWMIAVSGAYLTFLWLPISPEKIVTVAIAMLLLRWLFPNDTKTLAILKQLYASAKKTAHNWKKKHQRTPEDSTPADDPQQKEAS